MLEYAACQTSNGVRRLLTGLRPGMTEREAVRLLEWNGMPLSCHLMLTAGPRATLGLLSPGDRPIERGDRFTVAFGVWGALDCRAGFVVEDATELPAASATTSSASSAPYFEAVAEWYGALRDRPDRRRAATTSSMRHLGDPFFGIFLNPGHLIGLDEWINSPIAARLDRRAPVRDGVPGRRHPGDRDGLLHDQHRGRRRARRRRHCARRSPPATRRPGRGSRRDAGS